MEPNNENAEPTPPEEAPSTADQQLEKLMIESKEVVEKQIRGKDELIKKTIKERTQLRETLREKEKGLLLFQGKYKSWRQRQKYKKAAKK